MASYKKKEFFFEKKICQDKKTKSSFLYSIINTDLQEFS